MTIKADFASKPNAEKPAKQFPRVKSFSLSTLLLFPYFVKERRFSSRVTN